MTVSVGDPAPNIQANVLMEILGSSESVQGRITAFQKAKDEANAALEALQIGRDAKKAYEDADAKHAAAQAELDKANQNVDAALATIADAQKQAADIIADANRQRAAAIAEIERAQATHAQWIDTTKAEIAAQQQDADTAAQHASAAQQEIDAAAAAAKAAQDQAAAAEARYVAAEAAAKAKAAKLQAALADLGA